MTIKQQIREICSYNKGDGTSGFLLSEKQFEKLFDLVEGEKEDIGKMIEEAKRSSFNILPHTPERYMNRYNYLISRLDSILKEL